MNRIESLVSWMWTGAVLVGVGLAFVIRGWFLTRLGMPPLRYRAALDPQIALGGGILLLLVGGGIVAGAVVARLRKRR
jgi:hypothetical protein